MFYSDEADVDLNPRFGPTWLAQGTQSTVPTQGKNPKHYLAGTLHVRTGRVVWAEGERKDSRLFIHLLYLLKRRYRRTKQLVLIADIYVIHRSHITRDG